MIKLFFILQLICTLTFARGTFDQTPVEKSNFDFKCVNRMPMTSFILKTEGEFAVLTTIHHNGTAFMPIHEGIVVPNYITYLKDVSSVLPLMGDRNEFRFPITKCKIYGEKQMSCINGSTENFQGREMQALFLSTSKIQESAFGRTSDRIKVSLSVNVSNFVPVQDIMMNYEVEDCQMGF